MNVSFLTNSVDIPVGSSKNLKKNAYFDKL